MSDISFEELYGENKNQSLSVFLVWVNDFLGGYGISGKSIIDYDGAFSFVLNLRKEIFPHGGGYDKASPFKKAAYMYVWLHAINPFKSPLGKDLVGESLAKIPLHTTTLIGFSMVQACLHGVTITKKDGTSATLANAIAVSHHFMVDLAESSATITPATHFKAYSLLFEALAYEANDNICYAKVF